MPTDPVRIPVPAVAPASTAADADGRSSSAAFRAALAGWFAVSALVRFSELRGVPLPGGGSVSVGAAALAALPFAVVSCAVLWAAVALTRRHPLGRGAGLRPVAAHGTAAVGLALADYALNATVDAALGRGGAAWYSYLLTNLAAYALLAGLAHAVDYARRLRQKEVAELRLQGELARAELARTQAELRGLRLELNPHFLFNALHAVSSLLRRDADGAERVLLRLSDLLRRALGSIRTHEVSLEEEIETLRPFVEIEQVRYGAALHVSWEVEEDALDATVPHMILQPLVENAVKHGLGARGGAGRIVVRASVDGGRLVLEVEDDGVGPSAGARTSGTGVGMPNVASRLRQTYGAEAAVELRAREGGGAVSRVVIPLDGGEAGRAAASAAGGTSSLGAASAGTEARPSSSIRPVEPARRGGRRWARAAIPVVGVLLAWIPFYDEYANRTLPGGSGVPPALAVFGSLYAAASAVAMVYAAFYVARRFPLGRGAWRAGLRAHAAAGLGVAGLIWTSKLASRWVLGYRAPALLLGDAASVLLANLLLYAAFVGVAHAVHSARRFRQKEVAELRLQGDLARAELARTQAELRGLKLELNPHFLFNALHAVSSLLRRDADGAERVLLRLSDLLRRALGSVRTHEVSLEEEIETLRPFVEIEQVRYGAALHVSWEVEEDALDATVPHMILQPLVENAVKHGLGPRGGAGRIVVRASVDGGRLVLEVEDDGAGPSAGARTSGTGVGTANVASRLRQMYGAEAAMELRAREGGGAVSRVVIPLDGGGAGRATATAARWTAPVAAGAA